MSFKDRKGRPRRVEKPKPGTVTFTMPIFVPDGMTLEDVMRDVRKEFPGVVVERAEECPFTPGVRHRSSLPR
jgi:hypothetical protein